MRAGDRRAPTGGQALVDHIANEIQTRIMDGRLHVGSWLRQETLAAELGVSRTPVREALRQLQATGIIGVLPRRGALVRGPSARDVRETYQVRADLEGLAAQLAVDIITDEQLDRLRYAERVFEASVEEFTAAYPRDLDAVAASRWPEANDLFHDVILEACGNRRLRETVLHVHLLFPRNLTWTALTRSSRLLRQNVAEHARIRERIEKRDAPGARRAMSAHIRRAGDLVARQAESVGPGPGYPPTV